jgi:tetratricopeptide (TPR) repeat protein
MRLRLAVDVAALLAAVGLLFGSVTTANAGDLGEGDSWADLASTGESLIFGRFVGKFESMEFRSRSIRVQNLDSGEERSLRIDDALGYIAETISPGRYTVLGIEAVYYPRIRPFNPSRHRPIRQRYAVKPKTGDADVALIEVPKDRPVYIGTILAGNELDGVVYRGHQLRVIDDFDQAYDRLDKFYPSFTRSLDLDGVVPARHFMLRPSVREEPLERVVAIEDPIKAARDYIAAGKFRQAVSWLETFMPTTDGERNEARLLVGEAFLGDRRYGDAIEELGEVLLANPREVRALRLLARAHAYDRHLEDAASLYGALAEAVPEDAEAHLYLGYLHALEARPEQASREFGEAFQTDFDYLLHDVSPFFIAMREALDEEEEAAFEPPKLVKFDIPPPRAMSSRRSSRNDGIAVLIDHEGKVLAAQIGSEGSATASAMMLALIRATYRPASLNGVPVPSLLTMGIGEHPAQ